MALTVDYKARLTQINQAIEAIERGAQEYSIGSRRLRRADLRLLYDERRYIESQIGLSEGGGVSVAVFDRR